MVARGQGYEHLASDENATSRTRKTGLGGQITFTSIPLPPPPTSSNDINTINQDEDQLEDDNASTSNKVPTYTYAYGPANLRGLLDNRYTLACAIFASIGGLEFGYDQGVIANVLVMKDFVARFPLSPWDKGFMTAMLELGALGGALAAGVTADRTSRRQAMLAACVIFCIGSLLQCLAPSWMILVVGRGVGGVGVGALSMLAPLYMAEIAPPELRGSIMALEQLAIVSGVVAGFWIGFLTRNLDGSASWRIPLGLQIIPGLVLAAGSFYLPESPRLLVFQGRFDEALTALAKLRLRTRDEAVCDPLVQIELLEMQADVTLVKRQNQNARQLSQSSHVPSMLRPWLVLFDKRYRPRTMIGIFMMFFQQWTGINALLYYGPTLLHSIGIDGDTAIILGSGGIGIVQLIYVVPTIVMIDRWGRRGLLRSGAIGMAASHIIIALFVYVYQDSWSTHQNQAMLALCTVYAFTAFYGATFGPVAWILPSEVFPLSIRSRGVALSTASNWANNFVVGLVTPTLLEKSAILTFLIFAFACIAAYFWATWYVPETSKVSLEDMDRVFASSVGKEDAELRYQIGEEMGLHKILRELADDDGEEPETA